nr:hypothetical protein [Tanacetum cinerariifolium]
MIQPELEGSTQGYLLVSVEVLRYDKRSISENMGIVPTEMEKIVHSTPFVCVSKDYKFLQNQYRNGNVVSAPVEGNGNGINGIQSTKIEFEFIDAADAYEETKKINANFILENNLQQASTSGTQSDKAPVFDSDGSSEVHLFENCYDNEIFNMFTQEVQHTKLLEPIPKPHQVPQNDSNVISDVFRMEQRGGIIEQHPANVEETRVLYDSLYNNLKIKVKKVNSVNRKLRETTGDLTTERARYKNQEKCFEISKENMTNLKGVIKSPFIKKNVLRKR